MQVICRIYASCILKYAGNMQENMKENMQENMPENMQEMQENVQENNMTTMTKYLFCIFSENMHSPPY